MTIHELKINDSFFEAVCSGAKPFEIRKNDRNFKVGDVLVLREITPNHAGMNEPYTGRMKAVEVTFKTDYVQKDDYVVLGIKLI